MQPYEDRFSQRLEVFNECTILCLSYMLIAFTDLVHDVDNRYVMGYVYMGISLSNIAVHSVLLMIG